MKIGKIFAKMCAFICIPAILTGAAGCSDNQPARAASQAASSAAASVPAENASSQIRRDTIKSSLLKKDMRIDVYLPKGYSKAAKYPVLYMFHGYDGHEDLWQAYGLTTKADELIENKKIPPMIIAMPAIDNSYGINSSQEPGNEYGNDVGMYEDYICKEMIGYIDSTYSTDPSREARYIGGVSMGGYVALHLAFAHTDLFSKAGGHSPAIWHDPEAGNGASFMLSWLYPTDSLKRQRDPLVLAKEKDLSKVKVYLDCGTEDSYKFYEGCGLLYNILKERGVRAEYHTAPGGHEDPYWEANVGNYLLFYASK